MAQLRRHQDARRRDEQLRASAEASELARHRLRLVLGIGLHPRNRRNLCSAVGG